ncbi:Fic family protein [Flavobacterium psychrotolerans]|uniref:Cell filamentation protein Fic n=1 Tax=Flavobacterium psychrotolerans TaxID=2169410 RepID=A0A2U1JFR5_9FLAO|nr:Fic family protein [Flavobacterium psychrotolerans]PWA03982.1 cell filamentation protein Fic [Flavobacterium psychrotolerans]
MAAPREKLASSLEVLQKLQNQKIVGIKSADLSRVHKERLLKQGFIREVFKGWYIPVSPDEKKGDSTSWYISYWDFCSRYLQERYGEDYCVSADQSLLIHAGNDAVPHQLIIRSTKGNNGLTTLLFSTTLFTMKSPLSELETVEIHKGLRVLNLPSAIVYCSPSLFISNPIDVRTAYSLITDASQLLGILLDGGHSLKAGRIVGAFRNIGQVKVADTILKTMKAAGYDVREVDPFEEKTLISLSTRERSPYVNRIRLMWYEMRKTVIAVFPKSPGIPLDKSAYLKQIEEIYSTDAYHSLSIEKYLVTPELIERVKSGVWNAKENEADKKQRDAMAARGYWQAFIAVKESVTRILDGEHAGKVADDTHSDWYRELFAPSVAVGLLKPSDLAGYRNHQVYIGQSKHVPVNREGIRDVMPVLFQLLEEEEEASVRAVLGHFVFVFIHPYMDGNGRIGRFLMNVMLSSGGYPWTVIPVQERDVYMNALEQASVNQSIEPFAKFIAYLVAASIDGKPVARI